ncbi:MAG TPA: diacylglycerol kinase family protein, partial [Myxococcota bacterium]|nr:diacylglycerol kinase family protein [Myxococcota bacterium]
MVLKQMQPLRRSSLSQPLVELPGVEMDPNRVAVLLNRNARRVTDKLAKQIEHVVGRGNLYYSRSLDEAEAFAREIVQRGYGTVVCGGGDGTLVRTYNLVQRYVEESNAWRLERYRRFGEVQNRLASPRFAFLTLGTGNGLRKVVGATDPLADLRRLVEDGAGETYSVPVIEANGDRFLFAGLGYDSMLLNDYNWLRTRVHGRIARPLVQTVLGYFAALFARTLPRVLLKGHNLNARVTALGDSFHVDARRGDAACPVAAGATLYEGPVSMLGVGTTPFFGYGLKIFPFAGIMPNMMHLRVTRVGPLTTLGHLPSVWRGTYRNSQEIFDFLVNEVRVELDQPFPFQHSGDDQGL